jgi:hypothetical protein
MDIGELMRISPSGKKWTDEAEFGQYVAAIIAYSSAAELESISWYVSACLCRDQACRLVVADRKEIEDFVTQHQQEIVATIACASA